MKDGKNIIVLQGLEGNHPTHLKGIQTFLAPHADLLVMMWWVVWTLTFLVVAFKFVQGLFNSRRDNR
jgi:hypothetical protein